MKLFFGALFICFCCCSCVVQAPKYTHVEQVLQLQQGMTQAEVTKTLGIPPYDLKSLNDSGTKVVIYKYRVTDRRTVPFLKKETNGMKTTGKYVDLFVTYSPEGKLTRMESCSKCGETNEKVDRLDWASLITLVTVTLPALLVYFGLK